MLIRYGIDLIVDDVQGRQKTKGLASLEMEGARLAEFDFNDISNLQNMQRINLGANNLKSIDLSPLSGNTHLVELILYFNNLEDIDLSPLSSCVNLEYLDLAANNIREIDLRPLSSCTKLNAINLGGNHTRVIDLEPLSSLPDLKILTIDNMYLTEVDLSPLKNCTKLEFLKVNDNQIKSIDITPLSECKSLTDFEVDRIDLVTTLELEINDWPEGIRKHRKRIRLVDSRILLQTETRGILEPDYTRGTLETDLRQKPRLKSVHSIREIILIIGIPLVVWYTIEILFGATLTPGQTGLLLGFIALIEFVLYVVVSWERDGAQSTREDEGEKGTVI